MGGVSTGLDQRLIAQGTTSYNPGTSDLYPCFSFDPPTQNGTYSFKPWNFDILKSKTICHSYCKRRKIHWAKHSQFQCYEVFHGALASSVYHLTIA